MGGKSAPAPDYTPMANASKESALVARDLGQQQIDFAKMQYADILPYVQNIAKQQMAAQSEQMRQAQDYYNYMQGTFRPIERGLAKEAAAAGSEAEQAAAAARASADVERAFGAQRGALTRELARAGVDPSSGRMAGGLRSLAAQQALAQASGMTGARNQQKQIGYARRLDVAGIGRGLPGASTAAYGGATGAGSAATASLMAPGNQFANIYGQGAGTIMQGQGQQLQGLGNILNTQGQIYGAAMNQPDPFTTLASAGITAYGLRGSDIRIKENIERIGTHFRTGLPIYEFNYTHVPDKRFRGVMAQDVEKVYPDAVFELHDGIKAVNYDMLGIEMEEV